MEMKNTFSTQELESFIKHIPTVVFYKDTDLKYQLVSDKCKELHGEIIGKTDFEIETLKDLAQKYWDEDQEILKTGGKVEYISELKLNGQLYYVKNQRMAIFDDNKKCIGLLGFVSEVSEEIINKALVSSKKVQEEKTLAHITQILYSFNLTVDLKTGDYSLITGTGLDRTIKILKSTHKITEVIEKMMKLIHPLHKEKLTFAKNKCLQFKDSVENGFMDTFDYPVLYPGASKYEWQEINIFINTDEDGNKSVNILGRDITEIHNMQERSEKEIKATAAKNQVLSDLTKMLYSYNLTLNLRTGKYTLIEGTGLTKVRKIFKSTDDYAKAYAEKIKLLSPESKKIFESIASLDSLKTKKSTNGFIGTAEYGVTIEGNEEWHEINVFMSTDENGDSIANILGRDITEAHQRQITKDNAIKAAVARDQLLSSVTKMLYSYNITINLKTWQFTLIKGTGMDDVLEQMESTNDYVLLNSILLSNIVEADKEKVQNLIGIEALEKMKYASGTSGSITYEAKTELGESRWRELNLFIGTNEDGVPIANFLGRDVTEAHQKADTAAKLLIAEQANEAKTLFLNNMSHDIRTPMNAIIGFTNIAKKRNTDQKLNEYLDKILVSSDHLLTLINDVLDISRIESGKTKYSPAPVYLPTEINNIIDIINGALAGRQLEFEVNNQTENDSFVLTDSLRLREIIVNILSNSIKFTPDGGKITFNYSVKNGSDKKHVNTTISIADTGIGMSQEFLEHLFEPFAQEDNKSARGDYKGSGLGLSIVKRYVDMLGGTLSVESEKGKGTTFTLNFVMDVVENNFSEKDSGDAAKIDLSNLKVLLAEDNDFNAEIAMEMLNDAGITVIRAANGKEAVELFNQERNFDAIFMDIMMPEMNGYEATQEIRQLESTENLKHSPIIAMTANAFAEDVQKTFDYGMDAHLAKPINMQEITKTLARLM